MLSKSPPPPHVRPSSPLLSRSVCPILVYTLSYCAVCTHPSHPHPVRTLEWHGHESRLKRGMWDYDSRYDYVHSETDCCRRVAHAPLASPAPTSQPHPAHPAHRHPAPRAPRRLTPRDRSGTRPFSRPGSLKLELSLRCSPSGDRQARLLAEWVRWVWRRPPRARPGGRQQLVRHGGWRGALGPDRTGAGAWVRPHLFGSG